MSYTPPSSSAVDFSLSSGYTAPNRTSVDFSLGDANSYVTMAVAGILVPGNVPTATYTESSGANLSSLQSYSLSISGNAVGATYDNSYTSQLSSQNITITGVYPNANVSVVSVSQLPSYSVVVSPKQVSAVSPDNHTTELYRLDIPVTLPTLVPTVSESHIATLSAVDIPVVVKTFTSSSTDSGIAYQTPVTVPVDTPILQTIAIANKFSRIPRSFLSVYGRRPLGVSTIHEYCSLEVVNVPVEVTTFLSHTALEVSQYIVEFDVLLDTASIYECGIGPRIEHETSSEGKVTYSVTIKTGIDKNITIDTSRPAYSKLATKRNAIVDIDKERTFTSVVTTSIDKVANVLTSDIIDAGATNTKISNANLDRKSA